MQRTVMITGCSSGFGRATAEHFAQRGWNVVATARDPRSVEAWADGPARMAVRLDVTEEPSIAEAVAAAEERFGQLDVVVNNAGFGTFGPLEGATPSEVEAVFRTNVFGAASVIRHVVPGMRRRGGGVIVNVSSLGGRMAPPFMSLYCASKFALEGLSESLRYELGAHGIRVKLVEPGHFKTQFDRSLRELRHDAYDRAFQNHMGWVRAANEKAPGPEPVAEAIFRAATDGSAKLRYPVKASGLLAMSRLIPDALFRKMLGASMTQPARS